MNRFGAVRKSTFKSFPHSAHYAQQQMFRMRFKQKCIVIITQGRFDEKISQFSLQSRMQMDFRLLDGNYFIARCICGYQYRQHLTYTDPDIPVGNLRVGSSIDQNQFLNISEIFFTLFDFLLFLRKLFCII